MERIKLYFGGLGNIYIHSENTLQYKISSLQDLIKIIDHFNKYPLLTQKLADFELFKMVVEMMNCKEHLTFEGIQKIVAIKASINRGLLDELKVRFPSIIPFKRPLVANKIIEERAK